MSVRAISTLSRLATSAARSSVCTANWFALTSTTQKLSLPLTRSSFVRTFSASALQRSHGLVDSDLAHKLTEELKYEKENNAEAGNALPAWLEDFQKRGTFKVEDKPGEKEITFTRTFGNEKISLIFSTDALADMRDMEYENEGEEEGEEEPKSFPVNVTIIVEKSAEANGDLGALEIQATCQDASFFIDNVSYSKSSSLMVDTSAEGDWQRRGKYGGPVFVDLDDGLQDLFHKYLEERGFDAALADVIPNYIEYKEQKEYMSWLQSVSNFVSK
ncbi:Mitochondrial acidic protein mam33 [Quaeritorhiza haematococci]|nr:Mitochondrial acidic protein mam33 [Quaeritorhiza haematococci]